MVGAISASLVGAMDVFSSVRKVRSVRKTLAVAGLVAVVVSGFSRTLVEAQNRQSPPLPTLPMTVFTDQLPVRVIPVATGLSHPWGMAWLPDGSMLVTERPGRLRIIRHGVLDPAPISGVPQVRAVVLGGLMDVALHPKFAENNLIYLAYSKARADGLMATALARGRLSGAA